MNLRYTVKISKNVTVTINPTVISEDLVKMYQNDTKFYQFKFTDSTGKALANTMLNLIFMVCSTLKRLIKMV